ncbi:MAG: hypothetical protein ACLQO1_21190, partial [Steroidobacteraceae bacterium]
RSKRRKEFTPYRRSGSESTENSAISVSRECPALTKRGITRHYNNGGLILKNSDIRGGFPSSERKIIIGPIASDHIDVNCDSGLAVTYRRHSHRINSGMK